MNKYQRITNRIAKAELKSWNTNINPNIPSFREVKRNIRSVFKGESYVYYKNYYDFWHKKGVK